VATLSRRRLDNTRRLELGNDGRQAIWTVIAVPVMEPMVVGDVTFWTDIAVLVNASVVVEEVTT